MTHIGCRVNDEKDRDIIEAVKAYNDRTAGLKELLRLGIQAKAGVHASVAPVSKDSYALYMEQVKAIHEKRNLRKETVRWEYLDESKSGISVYID